MTYKQKVKELYDNVIARKGVWLVVQPPSEINSVQFDGGFFIHDKPKCIKATIRNEYLINTFFWAALLHDYTVKCDCGYSMKKNTQKWFASVARLVLSKELTSRADDSNRYLHENQTKNSHP